jgi:subtilisin family serine protease
MRARLLVTAPLALVVLLVAASAGAVVGPTAKPIDGARAEKKAINLATYPAKRWIVQLKGAPLATYRGYQTAARAGTARLDVDSQASRTYMRRLVARQHAFTLRLKRMLPGVRVQRTYQAVLNAVAVKMSRRQAARVRGLAGVRAVTPDIPYHLDMYATPQQIGAPTLWGQVGGQAHAGEGVKVAVVDSGIFVRHDAAGHYTGNPCFDDTGYKAPGGYPKGDKRFTNNKVLVARFYPRPDDPPAAGDNQAIQGRSDSSPHGTHVAGTIACNANTEVTTFPGVHITGIAPRAYLMNYRVFYTSSSPEDFQNGNAYTVELVKAIDDAVKDGADVISNSWGSSYQNTLAWPDPMIQAADNAVDAGVVMVFANGNSGPHTSTAISPAISPKVIGVGAVTKNAALVSGFISVTAPTPVPANLTGLPFGDAAFGPHVTSTVGPAEIVPAETVSTATSNKSLGCSLAGDASPFPAGSLTGKIALIQRGTCNFSEKVFNAQRGGAIAAFVYNHVAGGDTLLTMGPGAHAADVTIPSWFLRRTDGLNMVSWANANPGTAQAKFDYSPHTVANPGDVVASFSSRGPSQDKLIKPDVAAPGVDVLSSGYGSGPFPGQFTGFGAVSGTSMATPHVAGSAALLVQLHHDWKPWQVKSALMTTATEDVWLDSGQTVRAGVLDRGAGRIDLTKVGNPGLTVDQPSLSGGELTAGHFVDFNILAKDVSKSDSTWAVSVVETGGANANFDIVPGSSSISLKKDGKATIPVRVEATVGANPGSYEGEVRLTNPDTGVQLHLPVWLRVIPSAVTADVLLIDDDGSCCGFTDYASTYTSMLTSLGVSYQYDDIASDGLPSFYDLFGYKAVVIFTGDNDSFDTSGFFPSDQDTLSEWLDSGGRLWTIGQNFAEESDSNSFSSASLGRARLYHGYLGLKYEAGSTFAGAAPKPTATGLGPMAGITLDLSPGADGAGNQSSIEASSPMPDNDTYQAADTMTPLFRQIGGTAPAGSAISFGRSSEPSLEEERVDYRYRSVSMGFGLEGLNDTTGFTTRDQVGGKTLDWLLDRISFGPVAVTTQDPKKAAKGSKKVSLSTSASSSSGATIVGYRWDFGDKSHYVSTVAASVNHKYKKWGTYEVRVEATDSLGHRSISHQTIEIEHHH